MKKVILGIVGALLIAGIVYSQPANKGKVMRLMGLKATLKEMELATIQTNENLKKIAERIKELKSALKASVEAKLADNKYYQEAKKELAELKKSGKKDKWSRLHAFKLKCTIKQLQWEVINKHEKLKMISKQIEELEKKLKKGVEEALKNNKEYQRIKAEVEKLKKEVEEIRPLKY